MLLMTAPKSNDYSLFWVFLCHYKWNLLVAVIPRLLYSGFLFSQPFLVETTLDFIADPLHLDQQNYAYGLIASYAIVYIGIGVSCHIRTYLHSFSNHLRSHMPSTSTRRTVS